MTSIAGPTAEEQVAFLGNIERLLSEGQFVATYKYALLLAIADLAIKLGSDDGSELDLPIRAIAEVFIELYWRQSAPYGSAVADGEYNTLLQNTGRQAAIFSAIGTLRESHGTLTRAKQSPAWTKAVTETTRLVTEMPLWRLQRLRNEVLDFLYAESPLPGNIRLKSGVAANLRRFHAIIVRLAQSEWMHFIQALPRNAPHLDRWLARNQSYGSAISEAARAANIIVDQSGTLSVAGWAYAHAASLQAATWLRRDEVERLSGRRQSLLTQYG